MQKLESLAPDVWEVLGVLLAADLQSNYQRNWIAKQKQMKTKQQKQNRAADGDIEMQDVGDNSDYESEDSDPEYWANMETLIPSSQLVWEGGLNCPELKNVLVWSIECPLSSVAKAQLGTLMAQLMQLSWLYDSGSQAKLIFTAAEQLRVATSSLAIQI